MIVSGLLGEVVERADSSSFRIHRPEDQTGDS